MRPDRFDADRRLLFLAAGVIAGPFAEWAFIEQIVGTDEALKRDFRMRRNRQSGAWPCDDLNRLSDQAAASHSFLP